MRAASRRRDAKSVFPLHHFRSHPKYAFERLEVF